MQRQHEEAVKEVNQAMTVRIKASKDLKRLTEERNAAMQVSTVVKLNFPVTEKEKCNIEVLSSFSVSHSTGAHIYFPRERREKRQQT